MLHVWEASWGFRIAECPCDLHLTDYITERAVTDKTIYHFGTGDHHHVGISQAENGSRNSVLGITASTGEHESYVQLVIKRPEIVRWYNTIFGDIYMINRQLLPDLDIVTLFHICEFRNEQNDSYGALTDREMLDLLTDKLRPGGLMMFFPGSYAWKLAEPIVNAWAEQPTVGFVEKYKSLLVYKKLANGR